MPGWGRASKEAGHCHIGVALSRLKPLLQTLSTVPMRRACLEGVAPNLLTQVSWGGKVMRERVAGGPCRTAALPCGGLRHRNITSYYSHLHIPTICLRGAEETGTHPQGDGLSCPNFPQALSSTTHPDSSPSCHASWTCKCRMCGSLSTTVHSPPGIVAHSKFALSVHSDPPGCMHGQRPKIAEVWRLSIATMVLVYKHSLMKSARIIFTNENTKAKGLTSLFQATWLLFLHTENRIQIVSHSTVLI